MSSQKKPPNKNNKVIPVKSETNKNPNAETRSNKLPKSDEPILGQLIEQPETEIPIIPCSSYEPNLIDFVFPLFTIFRNSLSRVCISYDRTILILYSIVRCLSWIYLYDFIKSKNKYLLWFLYIFITINIIFLGIAFSKVPLYPTEYNYAKIQHIVQNVRYADDNFINTDDNMI